MHKASTITSLALVLVAHAAVATAGAPRGGARPQAAASQRRPNEAIFRDLDRSLKSVSAGTALTRAFKVPRGKAGRKREAAYSVKAEEATLMERTGTGRQATVQIDQRPHARSIKSSLIRLPSRTRPGSELRILNSYDRIEVTLRDPTRGEIRAEVDLEETFLTRGSVRYYTMPPGDHMRTRPPVSLADATAFLDTMGGFQPARGTRASRVVADFAARLEKSAAGMEPAERERLAPLLALLTPSQAPARSARPAPAVKTAAPAPRGQVARRSEAHPNAPLFEQVRQSLRVAAQGTALSRKERVEAAPGQRAYSYRARKATLSQRGKHGASSLHIEHNSAQRFRPIVARVSVPGTSPRGARLELVYTPHELRVQLTDGRRGTLRIDLENDVNRPGGVRYSVIDLAGSGRPAPISPAQALDFVRDVGGFDPTPGVRATRAVSELATRLDGTARRMSPAQRDELAPLIAALGGPQRSR